MRIKIHTRNIGKKLKAVSCQLSAFRNLKPNRGFTLVELLVTLSLFVILSGIVLFSQQKFNGSILLTNLAYDVALTVRQAQTFGINVREDLKTGSFQLPYGAHFDISKDKQFLIFADVNGTGKYETSSSDSLINSYSIKKGNYISDICITSSGTSVCEIKKLDISFLRPDPDAIFKAVKKDDTEAVSITDAKVIISSPTGDSRNVSVNSTGQISINRGSGASCSTTITNPMTFNYTGSVQCYQVPVGKTSITIEVYGAQGGDSFQVIGGKGGKSTETFTVSGGDVFYVYVGGVGSSPNNHNGGAGGWNGGGSGGGGENGGAGGGGASDVRSGNNKWIVAGGGGGGGGPRGANNNGGSGGSGGGNSGADGGNAGQSTLVKGGKGGTQSFAGSGGDVSGSPQDGCDGGDGSSSNGGGGGCGASGIGSGGGGGGGGYYGGGGGGGGSVWGGITGDSGAGGGGGSGYGGSTSIDIQSGNGKVEITAN